MTAPLLPPERLARLVEEARGLWKRAPALTAAEGMLEIALLAIAAVREQERPWWLTATCAGCGSTPCRGLVVAGGRCPGVVAVESPPIDADALERASDHIAELEAEVARLTARLGEVELERDLAQRNSEDRERIMRERDAARAEVDTLRAELAGVLASPSPPAASGWRKAPPSVEEVRAGRVWWWWRCSRSGGPGHPCAFAINNGGVHMVASPSQPDDWYTRDMPSCDEFAPCLPPGEAPSPPAAEPRIVARVVGEVERVWHDGTVDVLAGTARVEDVPLWDGAREGQRVEVLVRALDGVEVPAPPASEEPTIDEALNRDLTERLRREREEASAAPLMVDCDCPSYPCEHNPRGNDLARSKPSGDPVEVASAAPRPLTEAEIEECARAGHRADPTTWTVDLRYARRFLHGKSDAHGVGAEFAGAIIAKAAEIRARTPGEGST